MAATTLSRFGCSLGCRERSRLLPCVADAFMPIPGGMKLRTYSNSQLVLQTSGAPSAEIGPPKKVAIVGGGFAGLAAAYALAKDTRSGAAHPRLEIYLVEARDRLGGRVYPTPIPIQSTSDNSVSLPPKSSAIVDLGGQWVHESSFGNPLVQLINELEIPWDDGRTNQTAQCTEYIGRTNVWLDASSGRELSKGLVQTATRVWYKAIHEYELDNLPTDSRETTSLADLVSSKVQVHDWSRVAPTSTMTSTGNNVDLQKLLNGLQHRTEIYEGGRLEELSALLSFDSYTNLGGPDRIPPGGSYAKLLQSIVDDLQCSGHVEISLASPVECIQWSQEHNPLASSPPIQIMISEKDADNQESSSRLYVDYCICTVPLGVLQQRRIAFDPDLSTEKWQAVDRMGFGQLEKVILQFPTNFWHHKQFSLLHEDPSLVQSYYDITEGASADDDSSAAHPTLMVFLGGGPAERMQGQTDAEVVDEILGNLRTAFPALDVPRPITTHVTRWHDDPYSGGGAYSFEKIGAHKKDYERMATACWGNRLFFAGEHTSTMAHATVHGAWASGIREARKIQDQL